MLNGHFYISDKKITKIPPEKSYEEIILEFCVKEISWLCSQSSRPAMIAFGKLLKNGSINKNALKKCADNFKILDYIEYIQANISAPKEMFELVFDLKLGSLHDFSIDYLKFAYIRDNIIEVPSIIKYKHLPKMLIDMYGPKVLDEKFTIKVKRNTYENVSLCDYRHL